MSSSAELFEFGDLAPLPGGGKGGASSLEALTQAARDRGMLAGFEAGRKEALTALEPAMDAVYTAINDMDRAQEEFLLQAEQAAVDLALQLARKILAATIEVDRETVLKVVNGALRRTTAREQLVIEVHPDDFELVRDAADDLATRVGGIHRLDVIAERRVDRGGCVVRTTEGEIDAGIGEQLERAAEVFQKTLQVVPGNG
jgi:flagellar biosynthesis/type III secretory pathway protein FliH